MTTILNLFKEEKETNENEKLKLDYLLKEQFISFIEEDKSEFEENVGIILKKYNSNLYFIYNLETGKLIDISKDISSDNELTYSSGITIKRIFTDVNLTFIPHDFFANIEMGKVFLTIEDKENTIGFVANSDKIDEFFESKLNNVNMSYFLVMANNSKEEYYKILNNNYILKFCNEKIELIDSDQFKKIHFGCDKKKVITLFNYKLLVSIDKYIKF